MESQTKYEYMSAGCLVYNKHSKLYLLIQSEKGRRWGFPKGSYEEVDGDLLNAAVRETKEETGLDVNIVAEHFDETVFQKNGKDKLMRIYLAWINEETDKVFCNPGEIASHEWVPETEFASKISKSFLRPMAERLLSKAKTYFG